LRAFGPDFPAASGALIIVAAGKCLEAAAGPSRELLVFCGQERAAAKCVLCVCILQIALSAILVPRLHLYGAALVNAAITGALALQTAALVRRRLNVSCWASASGRPAQQKVAMEAATAGF
jgi:O-antigen/teichoic acid export membrane protein